jgi:hypothetical protein
MTTVIRECLQLNRNVNEVDELIARWFEAFQGTRPEVLTGLVSLPFTFVCNETFTSFATEDEFVRWWWDYVGAIRADGVVARGEILRLRVEPVSPATMVVRMQSARLDQQGNMVKILTTAFIVYSRDGVWRVGACFTDAMMESHRAGAQDAEPIGT